MGLFTVVGDPHAVPDNLDKIGTLFDILEEIGNTVIILGDLFDTKEIIRGRVFNYVFKRLSESKLTFHILVGNHDWFNLDCEQHSLEALKALNNVNVVDEPYTLAEANALLMPYYDDLDKFCGILSSVIDLPVTPQYLFMHQGVIGFDYGNGYIADGNGHGEINLDPIRGFNRVISGHFHKFAQQGNFMFLGTPFSHSFGETDQTKYIGVFDSETGNIELCETPFPRHRTLTLNLDPQGLGYGETQEQYLKECLNDRDDSNKDLWRVKLIGTEMQISAFDKAAFPGVKFLEEPTDSEQVADVSLRDTDSNEQKYLIWAKEIKGLDDETIALGLEMIEEAT